MFHPAPTLLRAAPEAPGPDAEAPRDVDRAGLAVLALAVGVHLWLCWWLRGFITDDSWISVRYAENLASGAGFVWNPGGPRAEGFSNPLLVLVEALADRAGWSAMAAARTLGVLSSLACLVLVHVRGPAVLGRAATRAALLLTACCAPFALWAVGGLETALVAVVLTAGVLELSRCGGGRPVAAAAALAVLPWLRPEGLAVAAAVAGLSELPGLLRRRTRGAALRRTAVLAGLPLASQAVLEALRLGLYGHLLPNSVLYKSGTGDTFAVLGKFAGQASLVLVLAAVGLLVVRGRARLLAVAPAVYVAGSIGTLDSANAHSRFFMPVWPLLALLAGAAVVALAGLARGRLRGAVAVVAAGAAAGVLLVQPPADPASVRAWHERYTDCRVDAREDVATWLRATPPGTSFAISDAGLVPARAGGREAVDSFFLNDPLIQETGPLPFRERAALVHERSPDVLVLVSREADRFEAGYPTDGAIHDSPAMAAYSLAHVGSGTGASCGYHLMVFTR